MLKISTKKVIQNIYQTLMSKLYAKLQKEHFSTNTDE